MKILTVKRLPTNEDELNLLKELFGDDITINIQDEEGVEPLGLRSATKLEIRFLDEMRRLLENRSEE